VRAITEYVARDGTRTYRVRFRGGGRERSETFRSKRDAQTFASLLDAGGPTVATTWLEERRLGSGPEAPTFGQFFETYVDQLTGVTVRTRADYRAQKRRYLTELDHLPLPLITRAHVTKIVNRLEAEGRSPKTIKNVVHMLSSCLALAMDEGHIARNPTRRVTLPKAKLGTTRARFLTHEEAGDLYNATPEHYKPLVAFLLGTGLRWSEATALQGRHVDLTNGTIRVEQAWKRIPGGWEIGTPKSEKALRTVNAAVLALLAVQPLLRKPRDLVFTTPSGKPVRHANFYNRVWVPACKAAGLVDLDGKTPRIHDTRHTFASWLISDGQSLEAVQDQLGHHEIQTTRNVYARLMPAVGVAAGRSASAGLERALNRVQLDPADGRIALEPVQGTD
jgi:integrase